MLLADIVTASSQVAATRSRKTKTGLLAQLLLATSHAELAPAVAFLTGSPSQGRIGTGWRTLAEIDVEAAAEPTLTVADVDSILGIVAETSGGGSTAKRGKTLEKLFTSATAAEQRFLFHLLTGELRQGALEGVMVDAIAAAASVPSDTVRRAFMLSGQLPATAIAAISGGRASLAEFRLVIGRPVRPMLASPAESIADAMSEQESVIVEYKMDGARIQVHRDHNEVHVYTRTLREITEHVAELVDLVREFPCESVVLDGETLALTEEGRPRSFQQTMSRFGSTREEQVRSLLLRPYFFDCLYLNGADLVDTPLRDRNAALNSVAGDHVIPGQFDPSDPDQILAGALRAGHEGVMVKALDAPYAAGRRGKAWRKVKPVQTIDLIVLAAEWGHGRRTGYLSNLHLGARDPDGGPPIMVGKTFKGLTDELLHWQTEALQRIETSRTPWTVHVRPELVVEVAADGAQVSNRYSGGLALRFARVLRYRPDKDATTTETIHAVRAMLPEA